MKQIDKQLVDSRRWDIGEFLLSNESPKREYIIVGKEDGEIQLAKKAYNTDGKLEFVINSYKLEDISLTDNGSCITKTVPSKTITTITQEEYFGRKNPLNELNRNYLEILRR
jgi:hypothetical protein